MNQESNLREELLKQLDKSHPAGEKPGQDPPEQIIARETTKIARLKRITVIFWILVVVAFGIAGSIELVRRFVARDLDATPQQISQLVPQYDWLLGTTLLTAQALLTCAVALTIALPFRGRNLTMRQIQARLAGIEEQLKNMAKQK